LIYKLRGESFAIQNDRGHKHISHGSRRVSEQDIKSEIAVVYDVGNIQIEGNVEEQARASTWPAQYTRCRNCGCDPTRRAYGGRGYCGPCYRMIQAIAALKDWDRSNPRTFNRVPKSAQYIGSHFSEEEFEIWRANHIWQAETRLGSLRSREAKRRGDVPVDTLDLEQKFARVVYAVRGKSELSSGARMTIKSLDERQRRALYTLLDEIEDQIPWRGFNSQAAYELIHRRKLGK
jgi:hypothetical protein